MNIAVLTKDKPKKRHKVWPILGISLLVFLLFLSFCAFFSAKWYIRTYGQMGFDAVLYTLLGGLGGLEPALLRSYLLSGLLPAVACTAGMLLILFFPWKKQLSLNVSKIHLPLFPVHPIFATVVCIAILPFLLEQAAVDVELAAYVKSVSQMSTIYQNEYKDPDTVQITFPEEKRNLIYIFLESMETTFFSQEQGGILDTNVIPELYALAEENINFSQNDSVGGYFSMTGAGWTVGSMVSHTAGIPLKTPPNVDGNDYGGDGNFLNGVTTITDILHENGYYQALMVGSDATFGGRKQYYTQHNVDRVYELTSFWEDGIVENGRSVWWGVEDMYLFEYAKQALTEMAAGDQPFAFTMLTVDTHHIGGYVCPLCGNDREEQYENVLACSSRQVAGFVQWLQAQPFYENTTVIIVGDHPSMDGEYIKRHAPEDYKRMVYNCILNSAVQTDNTKNRRFCALDMLPTTLAAMGCTIEGDRLGLGTNLFSDQQTLVESIGRWNFNQELSKNSHYYTSEFFFDN